MDNNKLCATCNTPLQVQTKFLDAHSVIVCKLDVWNCAVGGNKVRRTVNINSVPVNSIKIGTRLYKLKTSDHYELSKKAGTGYISVININGKWIHCKNQSLTTAPWPKGAKDLYMVLYQSASTKLSEAASKSTLPSTTDKLPPHHVVTTRLSLKRKQTNDCDSFAPSTKKVCSKVACGSTTVKGKCKCEFAAVHHATAADCVVTGYDMAVARTEWLDYRYYLVDEHWQRQACTLLGLRFIRPFQHMSGGPDVILSRPDDTSLRNVRADGNCLSEL